MTLLLVKVELRSTLPSDDDKGVLTEEAPGFDEGLFYDKANKPITEKLEEVGALLIARHSLRIHIHMIGERKKPIIFRATAPVVCIIEARHSVKSY